MPASVIKKTFQRILLVLLSLLVVACPGKNSPTVNNAVVNTNDPGSQTNSAPSISGTPDTEITVGESYLFTPSANDTDSDHISFLISHQPEWAMFDVDSGVLSGIPGVSDVGTTVDIVISVSDGTTTASLPAFNLTVNAAPGAGLNTAPTINGTPGTQITVGELYSFIPSANDADQDTISFLITHQPGWTTFDSDTGQLTGTPQASDIGTTSDIVISVTDGTVTTSLSAFNLTVIDVVSSPTDLDPAKPPSGNFDLNKWKLTLPVSQDFYFGSGGSSAAEILPDGDSGSAVTALNAGFEDAEYFFTATDGTMAFRTLLSGGATTTNTSYVRSELRELYNWTSGQSTDTANWNNEGTHTLEATLSVVEYWPDDPQTVVGQIHAKDSSKALIKLQWDGPDKPVRAIINEDPVAGNPFSISFGVVGISEFSYVISLVDNTMTITVEGITQSVTFGEGNMSLDWDNHVYYFKAGNYPQADKSGGGLFEVHFSNLKITHN